MNTPINKPKAVEFYQLAVTAEKNGEIANAITLLQEAISFDPEFYKAYNRLGLIYSRIEDREKAIQVFLQAVKLSPDEKSCYNLAVEFYKANDPDKAVSTLKKCLNFDPHHTQSHLLLAHIMRKQGKDEESIRHLYFILKNDPKNRSALGALVILYFDNEKYQECIQLADKYLLLYPKDTRISMLKTDALLKTGNIDESFDLLKKITAEDPGFVSFTDNLQKKKNNPEENEFFQNLNLRAENKISEYTAKIEMSQENPDVFAPPDAQDAMDLSLLYLFKGETEKALEYLKVARKSVEA